MLPDSSMTNTILAGISQSEITLNEKGRQKKEFNK